MSGPQEGKRRKLQGKNKRTSVLYIPLEVASAGGGVASYHGRRCNKEGHWPVCTAASRSSSQPSEPRSLIFREQNPFCPPWFPWGSCKLLLKYVLSCLTLGWGWRMGSCNSAKIWTWLKLTAIYYPNLSLEVASLQWTPKFQNSYIRQILLVQFFSGWGEQSWCFYFAIFSETCL